MHHSRLGKTACTLALFTSGLLALAILISADDSDASLSAEHNLPGEDIDSRKSQVNLSSLLTGHGTTRYPEVHHSATPSLSLNDSEKYFPKRLHPSNVVDNFNRQNFMKVFTYEPAPELDVPQNESVSYLLEIMAEVNENIDRLILQAAREVSEYYRQVLTSEEGQSDGQNAPGELYDLVYKNLRALLGTLDDYPILKESLFLWSSLDDDGDEYDSTDGDSSEDGPAGRAFKFSKTKTTTTPAPPKFICPEHMTELVNCWSYDVFDRVSDNAKYYLTPFTW